jgi:hypothetical protein
MYRVRFARVADSRLGRHVNHDPRSLHYPVRSTAPLTSVRHERHVPVFDQGDLGSCTGNAAVGCMATGGYFATVGATPHYAFAESGAVSCYSDATKADDYSGTYPPTDTGSDGLSVAKALKANGEISGYEHAFGIDQALAALMNGPWITGVSWFNDMFQPDAEGIVHPTGALAGGHEFVGDEYDAARGLIGFTNSWNASWGLAGRFYMPVEEYATLLGQDGDVTVFTPITAPAPTPTPGPVDPTPTPDPESVDRNLWTTVKTWSAEAHTGDNKRAATAVRTWAKAKGLR